MALLTAAEARTYTIDFVNGIGGGINDTNSIYNELAAEANAGRYFKEGVALTPAQRDFFIALGYQVEGGLNGYRISWYKP